MVHMYMLIALRCIRTVLRTENRAPDEVTDEVIDRAGSKRHEAKTNE